MADTGGIRAGKAFIELLLRDKSLRAGLKAAQRRLAAFGAGVRRIGISTAALATAAFAPIGISAVKAAADAEESLSRFRAVFGKEGAAAGAFADELAKRVGRSSLKIKDNLADFQSFFVGLGFGGPKARELSQQMGALLLDFASFNNLSDEEGLQRFISALSGSSEVLDRFGINIRQAALQQELLRMGIDRSWTSITEQEKALARLNIITRAMGDQGAIGDATRTAGSFANQIKRLNGELLDASVAIGNALVPVLTPFVKALAAGVDLVRAWIQANPRLVAGVFGIGAAAIAAGIGLAIVGQVGLGVSAVMGLLATTTTIAQATLAGLLSPLALVAAAAAAAGAAVVYYSGAGGAAVKWLGEKFAELRGVASTAIQGITDALAAGNPQLAAKVLWAGLKVIWQEGALALNEIWQDVWANMQSIVQLVLNGIEVAWIETTAFLSKIWTNFAAGVMSIWETATAFIAKRMLEIQGLFDKGLDVGAAKKAVDEQLRARLGDIGATADTTLADREQRRKDARADAAARNMDAFLEIGRGFEDGLAGSRAELESAKQALEAARQQAAEAKAKGPDLGGDSLADRLAGLKGLDVAAMTDKVSVRGTFNAAAIQGLAAGGPEERTAKATEESVRIEKRILDEIVNNGLTFA